MVSLDDRVTDHKAIDEIELRLAETTQRRFDDGTVRCLNIFVLQKTCQALLNDHAAEFVSLCKDINCLGNDLNINPTGFTFHRIADETGLFLIVLEEKTKRAFVSRAIIVHYP